MQHRSKNSKSEMFYANVEKVSASFSVQMETFDGERF